MVQLVTVRTLTEATQPRRLLRVRPHSTGGWSLLTVFALAVMEYAVGVSKFGKNLMTLLVHQY